MIEKLQLVSGELMPTFICQCTECPCLMMCDLFDLICEFCKEDNHQELTTIGASQFANEVGKCITVQQ